MRPLPAFCILFSYMHCFENATDSKRVGQQLRRLSVSFSADNCRQLLLLGFLDEVSMNGVCCSPTQHSVNSPRTLRFLLRHLFQFYSLCELFAER